MEISFTLDLEHHWYSDELDRFVEPTESLLELVDRLGVRGTIFVLGSVAETHPDLVRRCAAAGHEIALHGHHHTPLPELSEVEIRDDVAHGKELLEAVAGVRVVGYRAPYFSLTPDSRRAVGVLAELGFTYSSSVLPAANPQFGWAAAPAAPFVWPEGVVELPVPVLEFAGRGIPFLGGTYVRVLPRRMVDIGIRRGSRQQLLWTYCHPYDVDAAEPYRTIDRLGRAQSRLLWFRRRAMLGRIEHVLRAGAAPPLGERVAAGVAGLVAAPV